MCIRDRWTPVLQRAYKLLINGGSSRNGILDSMMATFLIDYAKLLITVSYTHLDVYKRHGKKSEGNTKIQQNPYKKESMAWAAWIIARLGAWSAYKSQSIPGYITFKNGLDRFYTQFELYELIS